VVHVDLKFGPCGPWMRHVAGTQLADLPLRIPLLLRPRRVVPEHDDAGNEEVRLDGHAAASFVSQGLAVLAQGGGGVVPGDDGRDLGVAGGESDERLAPAQEHLLAEHGAGLDTDVVPFGVAVGDLGDGLADAVDEESRI